jgi:rhodanese-related sulfurtransferase
LKRAQLYLLLPALFTLAVLSGCAYITGEAITLPVSSPAPKEIVKTSAPILQWVWSRNESGHAIIIDRRTHQQIKDVTPFDALGIIISSSDTRNPVVIDVRTPGEFANGHISGALNIDFNATSFRENVAKLDKTKLYIIYCQSGMRSAAARNIFKELGFQSVINVTGGIKELQETGFLTK